MMEFLVIAVAFVVAGAVIGTAVSIAMLLIDRDEDDEYYDDDEAA